MKKIISVFLCFLFSFSVCTQVSATLADACDTAYTEAANYILENCPSLSVGATGGEWAVIGLARGGAQIPEHYFEDYFKTAESRIAANDGVLHTRKYTEYSRVGLALTALGKNPADVGGYNLLLPLGDYEKTLWQGINGPIFALLCLDAGGYEVPQNPEAAVQASRELYCKAILDAQNPDGGWALSSAVSEPDMTAMALYALAPYRTEADVAPVIEAGLSALSSMQTESGGFNSGGEETAESCAQVVVALSVLGIPFTDPRFVKNGCTVPDALLACQTAAGGFAHTAGGEAALMPTEQALYALAAARRFIKGEPGLYTMTDVAPGETTTSVGLASKHPDVQCPPVLSPGKTFADIENHPCCREIETLAERGIINGKAEDRFDPEADITRAEFAAVAVRALGLSGGEGTGFADILSADWFYAPVYTAAAYGLVNGMSETAFAPYGTLTRQEAAAITARAAVLCGMQTAYPDAYARDVLSVFTDYTKAGEWARSPLAFCVDTGILPDDAMELRPTDRATRAEVAEMLYNLLVKTKLL